MNQSIIPVLVAIFLAACAAGPRVSTSDVTNVPDREADASSPLTYARDDSDMPAVLRSGKMPPDHARLDMKTGKCAAGALQLMSASQVRSESRAWKEESKGKNCTEPAKSQVPATTGYPAVLAKSGVSGSAQVLIKLERDGSVQSAEAVCTTDSAFAKVAAEAAKTIEFRPSTCDGKPARSAFLLPFNYDI